MWIFGIIFPKCLYTVFSDLLISFQPLSVYYFFKQSLRFFTWELIAFSTKINAMVLCTLKQKTPFDAAAIMLCAAAARTRSAPIYAKYSLKVVIAFYGVGHMYLIKFFYAL